MGRKICVGAKSDLEAKRVVLKEEVEAVASAEGLRFMDVSAKTGENVHQAFQALGESLVEAHGSREDCGVSAAQGSPTPIVFSEKSGKVLDDSITPAIHSVEVMESVTENPRRYCCCTCRSDDVS